MSEAELIDKRQLPLFASLENLNSIQCIPPNLDLTKASIEHLLNSPVDQLDINQLRSYMVKSIHVLQFAQYGQAAFEFKRLNRIREILTILEDKLLDPKKVEELSPKDKISLYSTVSNNLRISLGFLNDLNKVTTTSIETVNNIERMKRETKPVSKNKDSDLSNKEKSLLMTALKDKIREKVAEM